MGRFHRFFGHGPFMHHTLAGLLVRGFVIVVLLGALIAAVVALVHLWRTRTQGGSTLASSSRPDPVAILRQRYAEGQLSTEEFDERLARLSRS